MLTQLANQPLLAEWAGGIDDNIAHFNGARFRLFQY